MGRVFILIQTNSNCKNAVKIKKELEQSIIRKLHGTNIYRIIMMSFIGSILLLLTILLQSVYALGISERMKIREDLSCVSSSNDDRTSVRGTGIGLPNGTCIGVCLGDHPDQQARKLQQDPQVLKEILEILDQPDLEESKVQQRQQVQQDHPTRLKLNCKMVREVGILLLKQER